ncbi:hypothetical protein ACO0LB_06420 [Undibacterium sp. SXout7W]|uniref:hypothetical protein n=1 Tax=Undibacterium sp. SXout7W TaxID=3413049 RepID=UPI003BF0753F
MQKINETSHRTELATNSMLTINPGKKLREADLTSALIWRLTFAANVIMILVSLSTVFWGVLPWFGAVGGAISLAACIGMAYFKSKILNEDLTTDSETPEHGRRRNDTSPG